jgi:hypothetical protein
VVLLLKLVTQPIQLYIAVLSGSRVPLLHVRGVPQFEAIQRGGELAPLPLPVAPLPFSVRTLALALLQLAKFLNAKAVNKEEMRKYRHPSI